MSDRGIGEGMEGNLHDERVQSETSIEAPLQKEFTADDLQAEYKAYEGLKSEKTRENLDMLTGSFESSFYNDLIGSIPTRGMSAMRANLASQANMALNAFLPPNFEEVQKRKIQIQKDLAKIVEEQGIDLSDLDMESNYSKVFKANPDRIRGLYIALRNKGYTQEDLAPHTQLKIQNATPDSFYDPKFLEEK